MVVLSGGGGSGVTGRHLRRAAAATPGWAWTILGGTAGQWAEDPWPALCRADVVITHGGLNAVAEVAAARKPAVVVPQDRPHGEQRATARALARASLAVIADPGAGHGVDRTGWAAVVRATIGHTARPDHDDSLAVMAMRSGLYLPVFDELADPAIIARLSAEADEAGWHGVFVWDHVRWREPVLAVADPWITLAAVAAATERGPAGADGHAARAAAAGEGRPGDRDARRAQRWAGSRWGSAWGATGSGVSSRSPAKNLTSGGAHGCSTSRSTS